jgi:hypothetical protein
MPRRADGELILLWTLPLTAIIWVGAFLLFPGFTPPMSPTLSAEQVAAFYRDNQSAPSLSTLSETLRPEMFSEPEGEYGENKVEQERYR